MSAAPELAAAMAEARHYAARIDALARELEASAAATAPSRKSEIETATAKRLRAITSGSAITGAGTEHLAAELAARKD